MSNELCPVANEKDELLVRKLQYDSTKAFARILLIFKVLLCKTPNT